jgi:hypothetical protein
MNGYGGRGTKEKWRGVERERERERDFSITSSFGSMDKERF